MIGDQVLREIGGLLQSALRGEDLAVRLGGEEFALLLKGASAGSGQDVCNRLREAIAGWDWEGVAAGLRVTASIGIADDREARDNEALLQLADYRLYAAKDTGRNRVIATGCDRPAAAEAGAANLELPL
jgi:diguanylate cyclase (GGDEF)-like protein